MKRDLVLSLSAVVAAVVLFGSPPIAKCVEPSGEEIAVGASSGASLTIYNSDLGLVRDVRSIPLHSGLNLVRLSDVAEQIDPTSVSLQSLTDPKSFAIREQNYQYDLINPTSILNRSVGKPIQLRQIFANGRSRELSGTLLNAPAASASYVSDSVQSINYTGLVLKTDSGVLLNPIGQVQIEKLPVGLISKPSLVWKIDTDKSGPQQVEVAYQTKGMSWKADYVAVLDEKDASVNINSWVTLNNNSGASFNSAALKLLAGDVHKVATAVPYDALTESEGMVAADASPQFAENSFAEYHLYTLQGKTDLPNNSSKQMSLFNADNVPCKKLFLFEIGDAFNYSSDVNAQHAKVKIELTNSQANHLGMPMPKGKVRLYKRDTSGSLQFIGEDEIDHTPKDEQIRVLVGEAFDIVGDSHVMNSKSESHSRTDSVQVSLRNHKEQPVTVTVVQTLPGDWRITSSDHTYKRKDAHTAEIPVTIPANSEVKVNYVVETHF